MSWYVLLLPIASHTLGMMSEVFLQNLCASDAYVSIRSCYTGFFHIVLIHRAESQRQGM